MKNVLRTLCALLLLFFTLNCDDDDPIQYRLTTEASPKEGGSVSPTSASYNEGSEVEIRATANEEYLFKNWTGDASGNENPMKVMMTDDMVVTAVFEKVKYTLDVNIVGEGTVRQETLQAKSTDHESGTRLKLTAMPDPEWEFVSWEGDFEGTENPIEITMTSDMQLTVHFHPTSGEKIYVPDDNFEKTLINLGLDSQMDDHVFAMNIKYVKELDLSDRNIKDLTGIEGFASLESLTCSNNDINTIDLSGNLNLGTFICQNSNLQEINISENEQLVILDLSGNKLEEIDLNLNETLLFLFLKNNSLTSLDISALPVLWGFEANGNMMTCIKVNQEQLDCALNGCSSNNEFGAWKIDVWADYALDCESINGSKTYVPDDNFEQALIDLGIDDVMDDYVSTQLIESVEELQLANRQIQDLTGIEGFEKLKYLVVTNNNLYSLDISQNVWLNQLICDQNQLTSLDISHNPSLGALTATGNQLSCVQVSKDQLYWINWVGGPAAPWFALDEGVSLSVDCSVTGEQRTYIPDDNFEQALIDLGIDDVMDDYVSTINIVNVLHLDLSGQNISDLTGMQDFRALSGINISNNNLSSLDVSEWAYFGSFNATNNPLTCIQFNEEQLTGMQILAISVQVDQGVNISLDCND